MSDDDERWGRAVDKAGEAMARLSPDELRAWLASFMIAAGEGLSRTELRARAREFAVNYVWTPDATLPDFLVAFAESLRADE